MSGGKKELRVSIPTRTPQQEQVVDQLARIERETGTAFMFHVMTEHNLRLLLAAENGDRSLSAQKVAGTARDGLMHSGKWVQHSCSMPSDLHRQIL
jgi:hypothetical protein